MIKRVPELRKQFKSVCRKEEVLSGKSPDVEQKNLLVLLGLRPEQDALAGKKNRSGFYNRMTC